MARPTLALALLLAAAFALGTAPSDGASLSRLYLPEVHARGSPPSPPTLVTPMPTPTVAPLRVGVVQPAAGAFVGDELRVVVTAESRYEVRTVVARVEGRETALAFSTAACSFGSCTPQWAGTVSLAGLPRGELRLRVEATDAAGATGQAEQRVVHDSAPAIAVAAPIDLSVARPSLRVAATCADDDPAGCTSLVVGAYRDRGMLEGWVELLAGTSSVDATVSLAALADAAQPIVLEVRGRDTAGQQRVVERRIYVEPSTSLVEVAEAGGPIWDATADRLLFLVGETLYVRDRATGQETAIPAEPDGGPEHGRLTAQGALFVAARNQPSQRGIYEWTGGQPTRLGYPWGWFKLAGRYALWSGNPGATFETTSALYRRDLESGTTVEIAPRGVATSGGDVAPNGDVVYQGLADYQVYRWRAGATEQLTSGSDRSLVPATDGQNVAYRRGPPCCTDQDSLILRTPDGESTLASPTVYWDVYYRLASGWVAYTRPGTSGQVQVWLRSPDGAQRQLSSFASSSYVTELGPNGDVFWTNGSRLYLTRVGAEAVDVGSYLNAPLWIDGAWYVRLGRSLARVA